MFGECTCCVCVSLGGLKCERVAVLTGMWRREGSERELRVGQGAEGGGGREHLSPLSPSPVLPPPPRPSLMAPQQPMEGRPRTYTRVCVCVRESVCIIYIRAVKQYIFFQITINRRISRVNCDYSRFELHVYNFAFQGTFNPITKYFLLEIGPTTGQ